MRVRVLAMAFRQGFGWGMHRAISARAVHMGASLAASDGIVQ